MVYLGDIFLGENRLDESLNILNNAIALDSMCSRAYLYRGSCYKALNDYPKVRQCAICFK